MIICIISIFVWFMSGGLELLYFYNSYFNLVYSYLNHTLFLPVILSFKYIKRNVKIKSGISKCCYLISPVGTYASQGIQLLLVMPKSYRKSEAIAAPNQGKHTAFYLKIRLLIRVQLLQQ